MRETLDVSATRHPSDSASSAESRLPIARIGL